VEWLIHEIFSKTEIPFVIAGKRPSAWITKLVANTKNACLVADPSDSELGDLIEKAQVHILPSFNNTGIKLKLLHALFRGRHCVVNPNMVEGTGLEETCRIAADAEEFRSAVSELFQTPFTKEQINSRERLLMSKYDNEKNARRLIASIW
jgi:hypothetical protein